MGIHTSIYLAGLIFAILYWIIILTVDIPFIESKYLINLPFGVFAWSLTSLLGIPYPYPIIYGGAFFIISLLITQYFDQYEKLEDDVLLKRAKVSISIPPGKKGEVKIETESGNEFYIAATNDDIAKPIPRGTDVYVIGVEGNVLYVTTEFPQNVSLIRQKSSKLLSRFGKLVQTKKSGICIICYGKMSKTKNYMTCPECNAIAHFDHFKTWIDHNKICPNCRQEIEFKHGKLVRVPLVNT